MENTDRQESDQERFTAPSAFDYKSHRQYGQRGAYLHADPYQDLRNAGLRYSRCDYAGAGRWPVMEKVQHNRKRNKHRSCRAVFCLLKMKMWNNTNNAKKTIDKSKKILYNPLVKF